MASQKSEEILIWEDQEQDDYSQLLSNLQSNERHKTALLPAKRENETVSTTPNKHVKLDHLPQDHDEASPVDELISEGCPDLVPDDDEIIDGTPHEDEISELHDIPEAELEDLEVETEHVVCKSTLTVPAPSDETAHNVSQFQKRLRSVIKYLFHHAETVHWNDITKSTAWVGRSCYHPMRTACKHSVLSFIDSVIPLQTQAVLGDDHITPEKLRSLPPINPTADEVGVYGCYIRQVGRAGGLYIGSTAWSLSKRLKEHLYRMRLARQRGCTKGAFYKFYISRPDSIPYFFAIAAWPKAGSSAWLVRLIETIVMLILDTFAVSKASPTYTVGEEQLSDLKDKAGLRANEFVPLNSALPTKQTLKTALKRECVNCGYVQGPGKKPKWLYNTSDPLAATMHCEPCYRYRGRHNGQDRPNDGSALAAPKHGPCSNENCKSETSPSGAWVWDSDKTGKRVLCSACGVYSHTHGFERPREVVMRTTELRVCIDCQTSSTAAWRWHHHDDGWRCRDCHYGIGGRRKHSDKTCLFCHATDCDTWFEESGLCGPCHANDLQAREANQKPSSCGNCRTKLGKGGRKRRWIISIREFTCDLCYLAWEKGYLRVDVSVHFVNLDVRCETCNAMYSVKWSFEGGREKSAAEGVRLLSCSKCYQGMKLKSSSLGTVNRSEQDRQKGEMTYLEFREGKKKVNLHDLYAYLQRAHRIDRTRGAVEAAGGIARWYEANPMNRG